MKYKINNLWARIIIGMVILGTIVGFLINREVMMEKTATIGHLVCFQIIQLCWIGIAMNQLHIEEVKDNK